MYMKRGLRTASSSERTKRRKESGSNHSTFWCFKLFSTSYIVRSLSEEWKKKQGEVGRNWDLEKGARKQAFW